MPTAQIKTIADLFELDTLPPEEQAAFVSEAGKLVFEATLIRFMHEADDKEADKCLAFMEAHQSKNDFVERLFQEYPQFGIIFEEELVAFQSDILKQMKATATAA